ncbi:hypothetical protein E1265_07070 [Streptomyces sp. 8K308]|uniref:hypothetical protein n=1 Tax=Streptomyces sp. 8K308 TaxID=2530388 RepID=UPI00104C6AD6|nr:hypothetical protein [Streptomyces sp. 8K308]TDC25411.1 hypothetical protein E1265_07070 [Streptomyces sp. 8K308]
MNTPTAIRTQVAEATVTVVGPRPVTAWTQRYFGPWWPTADIDADDPGDSEPLTELTPAFSQVR